MLPLFRSQSQRHAPTAAESRPRRPRRARLGLEALEGRQLMSLGLPFQVNTTTRNVQAQEATATAANGMSVVVWTDTFRPSTPTNPTPDHDIRAQMFNANGSKRGSEIVVEFSSLDQLHPTVAMDSNGNFVVAYEEIVNGQKDVVARRVTLDPSTGLPQVGDRVAGVSLEPTKNEYDPHVAMDNNGNFVITYTVDFNPTDQDIRAREFDSAGNFVRSLAFGAATGIDDETQSSVAMDHLGDFVIAYTRNKSTGENEIDLARFTSNGTEIGANAITAGFKRISSSSVAMDDFSNVVVAYERDSGNGFSAIGARRLLFNSGTFFGNEIQIADDTRNISGTSVALRPNGGALGRFVVAYNVGSGAEVTEVNANNTIPDRIDIIGAAKEGPPAVSMFPNGDYLLANTVVFSDGDRDIPGRRGHLPVAPAAQNLALTSPIKPGHSATLTGQLTDADGDTNLT